ncbi:hypothetical protein [Bradyrhizobium sp. HKCCYLS20291]|uniref:hypothetical protein n=1 Tax=Bradyrhizobium sp. HKCCYLS20291 TaxID=3420766 RepID=UPI003EBF0B61
MTSVSRVWKTRARALAAAGVVLGSSLVLSGCSLPIADMQSQDVEAVVRPKEPGEYLPVNDVPRDRDRPVISPEERARIETELKAARDRQASAGPATRQR